MKTNECEYTKLVKYVRNNLEEQTHFGIILHMNKEKVLFKAGNDNNYKFFHRSCMKPMQASLLADYNLDIKYNLTEKEIAIACASHCGDLIHQELVLSFLNKIGCEEKNLLCHEHMPLSIEEQKRLIKENLPVRKIHNNCSGKHALMLAVCKHLGFDISNYTDFNHPLTQIVIKKVCDLCEIKNNDYVLSKDGCSLPVIATTLEELGRGYLNLFTDVKYEKIKNAFLNYPYIIGGNMRLDSEIINSGRNIIAKVGAGGLCVVVNIEKEECLVIKIADSNMEARSFAIINSMLQLKWLDKKEILSNPKNIYIKDIRSQDNEVLGRIEPCFIIE